MVACDNFKEIEKAVISATPLSPDSSQNISHAIHKCRSDSVLTDFTWVSIQSPVLTSEDGTIDEESANEKESASTISSLVNSVSQFMFSFLSILLPVVIVISIVIMGKSYVRNCVLWLEGQDQWLVWLVFTLLYVGVCFPVVWGYILLNIGCGYHLGFLSGLLVTAISVSLGLTTAHISMRACCSRPIRAHLTKVSFINSMIEVMKSTQAFKVILVSRLSPIPFGLQNAAFAVSCIGLPSYLFASLIGLLPTQLINIYLGTTLRSMEEVLTDETTAATGYIVLLIQILGSVTLMACIVRKAKKELKKTVRKESLKISRSSSLSNDNPKSDAMVFSEIPTYVVNELKVPIVKSSSQVIFSPQRNLFRVAIAS